jgi:hypothetical protein
VWVDGAIVGIGVFSVLVMAGFVPRVEILPPAQKRLWGELSAVLREFVLYDGTALALHLGHRQSVDFDFFGDRALDVPALETGIAFLGGARILQRQANTLSALIDRGDGNLRDLPDALKLRLTTAVREVDLDHLPSLGPMSRQRDYGHEL